MQTITNSQYEAVRDFANGLLGCFRNYEKNDAKLTRTVGIPITTIIELHLQLAELKIKE